MERTVLRKCNESGCGGASFSTDIPVWTNVCQHPVLKLFSLKGVIKYSLSQSVKECKLQNN
jgi:hypothetical protein